MATKTNAELTNEQLDLINDLLPVSRSLADWAREEMERGETVQGIKRRFREAANAAGRT